MTQFALIANVARYHHSTDGFLGYSAEFVGIGSLAEVMDQFVNVSNEDEDLAFHTVRRYDLSSGKTYAFNPFPFAPATEFECEISDFGYSHSPLCNESDMMVSCNNYFPF